MGVIRERVSLPVDGGRKQDAVMRAVTVYRLGGRDVNFRGTSLFSGQEERKKKIEIGIFFFRISQPGGGNAPSGRFHLGPERLSRSNAPDLFPPDRPSRPVGRLLKWI